MTSWQEVKLGDICDVKGGKRLPKGINLITTRNTHPYIRVRDLGQNKILQLNPNYEYVDDDTQKIIAHYTVSENDVLISIVGTIGLIGIVGNSLNNANLTENCVKLINLRGIDKDFLYYFLMSQAGQDEIKQGTVGAVQAKLPIKNIQAINIHLPPLDVQKKIAGVLSALDDKIELNNKINNNLEQQAQALIQEHINNLKTIVPLDEFCNVFTGRKNANEFESGGVNKFFTCGPEALTINSFIYDGPAVIISGNGAYTGRTRFYNGKFDLYQRTYACTLKEQINGNYIYLLYPLLKMVLEKKLMGGTHGSAIPYIVMNDIAKFEVPFEKEVFDRISPACKALVDKIQFNEQENEKLASLRDALLPKLMSGEIDVSNVDISALTSTDKLSFTE